MPRPRVRSKGIKSTSEVVLCSREGNRFDIDDNQSVGVLDGRTGLLMHSTWRSTSFREKGLEMSRARVLLPQERG